MDSKTKAQIFKVSLSI